MSEWGLESTYSKIVCGKRGEEFVCETYADADYARRLHNADIATLTARAETAEAERDELKARLAKVVEMLKPDGPPIPGGMCDKENRFYWRYGKQLHTRAVAIAEGRDDE